MIEFSYSSIPVGFRASQKTYPGEFLRPEVILSRIYVRNCCVCPPAIPSSIWSFFKNAIISEPLGVEANIFRIFISLWYLPLVKISKKSMRQGWHALDDLAWNYPVKHLFLLATVTMITVKMSFTHFHSSSCQGNIFLHQNHAIY